MSAHAGRERGPAPGRRRPVPRTLARFVAIGLALFAVRRIALHEDAPRRPLVVRVAETASDGEVKRAVDDAILIDLALRAGWARSDPVVRERILKSLEAVDDEADGPSRAVERGLAMGIATKDPVARSRLIATARRTIERSGEARPIGDDEIASYVTSHRDLFLVPGRARFDEVFLSRAKRAAHFDDDVAAMAARIRAEPTISSGELRAGSDPPPLAWPAMVDERRLDSLLGAGFGASVLSAPAGAWSEPIHSAFGAHFVRVKEVEPARVATVPEVRARVIELIGEEDRRAALDTRMVALRDMYRVSIERRP